MRIPLVLMYMYSRTDSAFVAHPHIRVVNAQNTRSSSWCGCSSTHNSDQKACQGAYSLSKAIHCKCTSLSVIIILFGNSTPPQDHYNRQPQPYSTQHTNYCSDHLRWTEDDAKCLLSETFCTATSQLHILFQLFWTNSDAKIIVRLTFDWFFYHWEIGSVSRQSGITLP